MFVIVLHDVVGCGTSAILPHDVFGLDLTDSGSVHLPLALCTLVWFSL